MIAAWLFVAIVVVSGILAHVFAGRKPDADAGAFWAQVVDRVCIFAGIPFLAISSFHTYPMVNDWLPKASIWWLLIFACVWLIVLTAGVVRLPDPASGRWLAGILEFSPHRFWVLLFCIPFVPALFFLAPPWIEDISAGHWAMVVLFFASLAGLALSASPMRVRTGEKRGAAAAAPALYPWPEEMQRRGVALRPIAEWEASVPPEPAAGLAAEWQQRLATAGSPEASGVLCDAVSKLITAVQVRDDRVSIVLGPDQCGQVEVLALAATELARRYGETTLVVTAWSNPTLADNLRLWLENLGGETPARLFDLSDNAAAAPRVPPDLLVVDAETLSDSVLDRLRAELESSQSQGPQGLGLSRIGLVVWWNAHEFSGVDAAHVWAVSRRLERLLNTRRAAPARAAVFARRPRDRDAAFLGFLEHLLPYRQTEKNQYQIASSFMRKTHLYRLEDSFPAGVQKAIEASALTEWKTFAPSSLSSAAVALPLTLSPASAGACILEVRADEVLSLREIVCQGGRAGPAGLDHHVALASSDGPYIDFLLNHYNQHGEDGASLNLIGAEGHAELVERHLLLGLREVPDTLTGVRANFRWEETTLRKALDRLSQEGRLRRLPVRFLSSNGRLQRDFLYANHDPGQRAVRSFRIVGRNNQSPVELRDPNVQDRLLLQLDPERLALDAYPQRVIRSGGQFYRVQEWPSSVQAGRAGAAPARISCMLETSGIRTWPYSTMRVANIRPTGDALILPGLQRYTALVNYHEDVSRVLERSPAGTFRRIGIPTVRTHFETEALILEFTAQFSMDQLLSAAAALQYVVPVHTAVEENALRVTPVFEGSRSRLALVDLYPGGIGVINAIHRSTWLMTTLFDHVAAWLGSIGTRKEAEEVAQSPIFQTRDIDRFDAQRTLAVFASTMMRRR
jgi:hypothetical protein